MESKRYHIKTKEIWLPHPISSIVALGTSLVQLSVETPFISNEKQQTEIEERIPRDEDEESHL